MVKREGSDVRNTERGKLHHGNMYMHKAEDMNKGELER